MNKRRVILTSLSGAIILTVASISFSIAWYASGALARVEYIEVNLNTEEDLLISTSPDEETFKNHLEYEELDHSFGVFQPVSSVYSYTWVDQKLAHPYFYDSSMSFMSESGTTNIPVIGGYLVQDLYLYSIDDVYVSINPNETGILSDENKNLVYAQEYYDELTDQEKAETSVQKIADGLNELYKAMRFMLINPDQETYDYAIIDPNYTEDTYLAGVLDNNIDRYYDYTTFAGENEPKEILYGEVNDRSKVVYDAARSSDSIITGEPSAFNARHAKGVRGFNLEKSIENGLELKKENAYLLDEFDTYIPKFEIPVKRFTPTKFTLCIYIEGWDLDSVNYTMGASFLASLSFKITRRM